jgi:hypothetical protein
MLSLLAGYLLDQEPSIVEAKLRRLRRILVSVDGAAKPAGARRITCHALLSCLGELYDGVTVAVAVAATFSPRY